jgi:hypothetical protein
MSQAMFEYQVTREQYDEKELDYDAMFDKYENRFIDWIYDNYPIGNGDMLIHQMEDSSNFEDFVMDRLSEQELIYS